MNRLPAKTDLFKKLIPETPNKPSKILNEETDAEAAILAASVARYRKLQGDNGADALNLNILRDAIREDQSVAPYLAQTDGNIEQALTFAEADLAFLRSLRKSGWRSRSEKRKETLGKLGKALGIPLLVVLVTALLGNYIASSLQEKAFQRQRLFESKLQRLKEGEQRSASILAGLKQTKSLMTNWELYGGGISPRFYLKDFQKEITELRPLGFSLEIQKDIATTANEAERELDKYLACLEHKVGETTGTPNTSCSQDFKLSKFEDLVEKFSKGVVEVATQVE